MAAEGDSRDVERVSDAQRDILLELSELMGQRRSVREVFAAFMERVVEAAAFDYVSLLVMEPDARFGTTVAAYPEAVRLMTEGVRYRRDELGLEVMKQYPEGFEFIPAKVQHHSIEKLLAANVERGWGCPLFDGDEIIGALTVGRSARARFEPASIAFLRAASRIVATAVRQDRHLEQLERQAARSALVNDLALLLNNGESMDAIFDRFREMMAKGLRFEAVLLTLADSTREWHVAGSYPAFFRVQGERFAPEELAIGTIVATGWRVVDCRTQDVTNAWPQALSHAGFRRCAVTPLLINGEPLGLLAFAREKDESFGIDDRNFIGLVVTLLEQAVANHRQAEQARLAAARSQLLNEVALLLNEGEAAGRLFDRILALLEQAMQFDYVGLLEATENAGELRQVGSRPAIARAVGGMTTFSASGLDRLFDIPGVVQFRTEQVKVGAIGELLDAGIVRVADVLLRHDGEPVGAFIVGRSENHPFIEDECQFLLTLCNLLGQAIGNRRRVERIEQDAARTALLNELSFLLNAGQPVESLFDRLPKLIRRAVPCDYVGLATVDAESPTQMRTIDWNSRDGEKLHPGSRSRGDLSLEAIGRTGAAIFQFRLRAGMTPLVDELRGGGLRRSMLATLREADEVVGLLHLSRGIDRSFSPEEMRFLEVVARLFAQAVANQLRIARAAGAAEEERIIAAVGAVAAGVADPRAVMAELLEPVSMFVPSAVVAFGYVEGDDIRFLGNAGELIVRPGTALRRALIEGQATDAPEDDEDEQLSRRAARVGLTHAVHTCARSAGSIVGVFTVGTTEEGHSFSERDLRVLRRITQIVGPAMAHADVTQRRAAEAEEQRIIAEVAAAAARESHPEALLNALVAPLRRFVSRPHVGFAHVEGEKAVYYVRGAGETPIELTETERTAVSEGQVHVREVHDAVPEGHQARMQPIHAGTITAAVAGGVATGLLYIASKDPSFDFSERDLRVFRLMAQIVGPAMDGARTSQRAIRDAEEQRIVAEIGAIASGEADSGEMLKACAAPLGRLLSGLSLAYAFVDIPTETYCFSIAPERRFELGPLGREMLTTGQAWGPIERILPGHPAQRSGVQAVALTANYAPGTIAGVLCVSTTVTGHAFSERELRLFRQATQIIGPAMEAARTNERIARQSELYNLILSSLSEAVVVLGPGLNVVFENANGRRLTQVIDPDRKLHTVADHLPALPAMMRDDFARAATDHVGSRGRVPFTLDGKDVWYDYELVPLEDSNLALLAVASDVTAEVLREQEQLQHRDEMAQASRLSALGELIGGVAHELNNPLTAILGFAEMMAAGEMETDRDEALAIIQKEALRARNIVRDLLFIARPGAIEKGPVSIAEVVGHVERLRRAAWLKQGVKVSIELQDTDAELMGNENQLTQVLLNLVTNAEFAVAPEALKEITIHSQRTDANELVLEVRDSGIGMDEATAGRVFEPFFTTKQGGQGTGLGLSLSHSIVASHGGRIEVESEPGFGSVFRIFLPLPPVVAATLATPAAEAEPAVTREPARARVLVVDDEPSLRKVCQRMVESMGHECAVAANAEAAAEAAQAASFDLVLCDYRLAAETADDVVHALLGVDPNLIKRIVIATGATTDAGVVALTARYNLRLVAKPYGFEEIRQLLGAVEFRKAS